MIVDIKSLRELKEIELKRRIKKREFKPKMLILQVDGDKASDVYVNKKTEYLNSLGITVIHQKFPEFVEEKNIVNFIRSVGRNFNGIMLQLPLPDHLKKYEQELLDEIPEYLDVDRLSTEAIGMSANGYDKIVAPTAQACLDVIENYYDGRIEGLEIVLLGRSKLVGKPLYNALLKKDADTYMIHSKSGYRGDFAEAFGYIYPRVVVTAMGIKGAFDYGDLTNRTELVIDCGINFEKGKMYGDYSEEGNGTRVDYTPVGKRRMGIGGLTVFNVANNLLKLIERVEDKCLNYYWS